jgi:outer membrane lipoprotein-sorting protein
MRKSTFLIAGIALGVFISKQIESNPETKKTLQDAAGKVKSFANAISTGYREQEAKAITAKRPAARTTKKPTTPPKRTR